MTRKSILTIAFLSLAAMMTITTVAEAQRGGGRMGGFSMGGGGARMGGFGGGGMRMGSFAGPRMGGGFAGPRMAGFAGPRMGFAGPRVGSLRTAAWQGGAWQGGGWRGGAWRAGAWQGGAWRGAAWRNSGWRNAGWWDGRRHFRRNAFFAFGIPAVYGAYAFGGYPYYDDAYADTYAYDDCYQLVRVATDWGPRLRRVWVCG